MSEFVTIPENGQPITKNEDGSLNVPNNPYVTFIEGDGIGVDITPVMQEVVDAAVEKAYGGERKIAWIELFAGEKASRMYGDNHWLPEETITMIQKYLVGIKGPLTTPVGGGIRSLNVAIRQQLDLFVCQRPVRYFEGSPSPLKHPEHTDMVIFRENSEGIYIGIEWRAGSSEAKKLLDFLEGEMCVTNLKHPEKCGVGVKLTSEKGSKRLIRKAIQYAIDHDRDSVTLVHKGNIMKYTEGAFREWGYELAREDFGAVALDGGPWHEITSPKTGKKIVIKDAIADAFLQQILLRPTDYDVIATMNLNGDYISDALAAQVGGIGIAPGANLGKEVAMFEATHGTAPGYAKQDKVNPGSLILSAEMMLRHLGWCEAADLIIKGISGAIQAKQVTYDFARSMPDAQLVPTSGFGKAIIACM